MRSVRKLQFCEISAVYPLYKRLLSIYNEGTMRRRRAHEQQACRPEGCI